MNILICKEKIVKENLMLLKPQISKTELREDQRDQKDLQGKVVLTSKEKHYLLMVPSFKSYKDV